MDRFNEPDHSFQNRLRAARGAYSISWELVRSDRPDVYVVFINQKPMAFVWREGNDHYSIGWNWLAPAHETITDVAADHIEAINNAVVEYQQATRESQAQHERRVAQDLAAARGEGAAWPYGSVLRPLFQRGQKGPVGPGTFHGLMAAVADGKHLDAIGASVGLLRRHGETDGWFRARVAARLKAADGE